MRSSRPSHASNRDPEIETMSLFKTTRRAFITRALQALGALGAMAPLGRGARAMGDEDQLQLAWLRPDGSEPGTRASALKRLLQEVEKRTSVKVDATDIVVSIGEEMFNYPMLFWSGSGEIEPLSDEQIDTLRTWLKGGGFLVVDSHEGLSDGPFLRSARRELERVFPDEERAEVPSNHVLYKSFYLIKKPYGRLITAESLEGYFEQDRVPVILSANDMLGAWARDGFGRWEYDVVPGGEDQREYALRMGVNLVMYALCVNYKEDQVHIPFILKRRNWKVD